MLLFKCFKLIVQEHQAGNVFQDLHLFISLPLALLQVLFRDKTCYSTSFSLSVATLEAYFLNLLSLALLEKGPPCEVARLRSRVGRAGDFEASEVLCSNSGREKGAWVWSVLFKVGGTFLRIVELVRHFRATNGNLVGIQSMSFVDQFHCFLDIRRHFEEEPDNSAPGSKSSIGEVIPPKKYGRYLCTHLLGSNIAKSSLELTRTAPSKSSPTTAPRWSNFDNLRPTSTAERASKSLD